MSEDTVGFVLLASTGKSPGMLLNVLQTHSAALQDN
jgi:hypothetical protein